MVEAKLVFGRREAVRDGPALSFDADPHRNRRAGGAPGGEKGQVAISEIAADQKAPGPKTGQAPGVFGGVKTGQFQIGPVEPPLPLAAGPSRSPAPSRGIERAGDPGRGPGNRRLGAPAGELAGGIDAEPIALASPAQGPLALAHPRDTITDHPGERHPCRNGPLDHGARQVWLGCEGNLLRYARRRPARRILGPGLGQIESPINKGASPLRDIGREYADLAVGDLPPTGSSPGAEGPRAGVLPRHTAGGLALLQEPCRVHNQDGIWFGKPLDHVRAYHIAQRLGIPAATPQDRLLPQGPGSPAASARVHPVLRRSSPNSPLTNRPAEAATRSGVNSRRIRPFTSRSDAAQAPASPRAIHRSSKPSRPPARSSELHSKIAPVVLDHSMQSVGSASV